ncbi:MAG: NAD-binding protein [bacterium]|nr:NAD-binding protein [bacterium]
MKTIIVGGGKTGFYAAKTLREHGKEVVIIEKDRQLCERLAVELDISVLHGDGTAVEILVEAGISKAEAFIAATGKDENNIVACQLAKKHFKVKKVIARVNNPKNVKITKMLGADIAVSGTQILTNLIEMEIDNELQMLATLNKGEAGIIELIIPDGFNENGKDLSEMVLPKSCILVAVVRDGEMNIPRGDFVLRSGDSITAVVGKESQSAFKKYFRP